MSYVGMAHLEHTQTLTHSHLTLSTSGNLIVSKCVWLLGYESNRIRCCPACIRCVRDCDFVFISLFLFSREWSVLLDCLTTMIRCYAVDVVDAMRASFCLTWWLWFRSNGHQRTIDERADAHYYCLFIFVLWQLCVFGWNYSRSVSTVSHLSFVMYLKMDHTHKYRRFTRGISPASASILSYFIRRNVAWWATIPQHITHRPVLCCMEIRNHIAYETNSRVYQLPRPIRWWISFQCSAMRQTATWKNILYFHRRRTNSDVLMSCGCDPYEYDIIWIQFRGNATRYTLVRIEMINYPFLLWIPGEGITIQCAMHVIDVKIGEIDLRNSLLEFLLIHT